MPNRMLKERAGSSRTLVLTALLLLMVAVTVRLSAASVQTSDYIYAFRPWFDVLRAHPGLSAFAAPFADYTPLYLYALKALTLLPVDSLWSLKAMSTAFDIGLATLVALMLRRSFHVSAAAGFFCFALLLALPTVALNSAAWSQVDAAYTLAVAASLWCIVASRPRLAVICFGVAISLKLQAIFFAPALAGYLLKRGRVLDGFWIPAIFVLSCAPALLAGASLDNSILIYLHQAGTYDALTMLAPSVFAFLSPYMWNPARQQAGLYGGILAAAACSALALWWIWKGPDRPRYYLLVSLWCVASIPFVLPRMHERYFFMADILSVAYAVLYPRRAYLPILIVSASFLSYVHYLQTFMPALSVFVVDLRIPATLMLAAVVLLTAMCQRQSHDLRAP